jgi:hypothetical protein
MMPSSDGTMRCRLSVRQTTAVACLAAATVLVPATLWARRHDSAAALSAKIEREHNSVKKAKLEVRLARVELEQAIQTYDHNQPARGQALLAKYLREMRTAWSTLKSSRRDAARKPSGFMQLEMALVGNARLLNDLGEHVDYTLQGPIETTLHAQNDLHSEVLLALFPGAAPPSTPPSGNPGAAAKPVAKQVHP